MMEIELGVWGLFVGWDWMWMWMWIGVCGLLELKKVGLKLGFEIRDEDGDGELVLVLGVLGRRTTMNT